MQCESAPFSGPSGCNLHQPVVRTGAVQYGRAVAVQLNAVARAARKRNVGVVGCVDRSTGAVFLEQVNPASGGSGWA